MGGDSMRPQGIRIMHIPSGITVECSGYRDIKTCREQAMKVLRAKLYNLRNPSISRNLVIEHGNGQDIELFIENIRKVDEYEIQRYSSFKGRH